MGDALLAIETSQRRGGVAVRDAQGRVHVEPLRESARHDDDLVAAIDRLYARAGLSPADTGAVGVSIGPGGFTGLRISVAAAKMLAEALGAALVAVPSALVVAESHDGPGPILVALASKDERVWATRLEEEGEGRWRISGEPGLADAASAWLSGTKVLLGDHYLPQAFRDRCRDEGVEVRDPVFDPGACLAVAARWLIAGRTVDPSALAPLYARPPAVTLRTPGP